MLLDEHLQASVREGLRPVNEVLSGKDNIKGYRACIILQGTSTFYSISMVRGSVWVS